MSGPRGIAMLVRAVGERVHLCAPLVGRLQGAATQGSVLVGGQGAGWLVVLGHPRRLLVPAGVEGRVANAPPAELSAPVAWGDVLFELEELAPGIRAAPPSRVETASGALAIRAPHAGRFWSRPAPDAPAYAAVGSVLEAGSAVGLIEVMKTFGQVAYRPGGALPPRAKIVRVLVADGAEVDDGTPLVEIEAV